MLLLDLLPLEWDSKRLHVLGVVVQHCLVDRVFVDSSHAELPRRHVITASCHDVQRHSSLHRLVVVRARFV